MEVSVDIVGGGPRTGAAPTRFIDPSERSSGPMDGTVAAASGVQAVDKLGRIRTQVRWGQGIPLRPARTIQHVQPRRVDNQTQTTSQAPVVQTSILSDILPGHASVTDAVTRLQRERDLALRRVEELHDHYKKELKKIRDFDSKLAQMVRMKDEVNRSNKAVDKMRDETIRLRSKVNELRDEKSDLQKQHESHIADDESAAREHC